MQDKSLALQSIGQIGITCKDRGVRFDREPALVHKGEEHDLWLAFFRDLENNILALMSEVPR